MEAKGTAVVTGASRGIGRATAIDLADAGFDVVATMRDPSMGTALPGAVTGGGSLRVARLDVTEPNTIDLPDDLRVVVNNAGVELEYLPVEHLGLESWRSMFETNVFGLVEVTRRAIPILRANGGGVICNISSSSIFGGIPFYAAYRASKAAVSALSESLRVEVAAFGIRVVDVLPGPVQSDMLDRSDRMPEAAMYDGYEELAAMLHQGRQEVQSMVEPAAKAAAAIRAAILDDDGPLKHACDPLGSQLLEAWRRDPEGAGL